MSEVCVRDVPHFWFLIRTRYWPVFRLEPHFVLFSMHRIFLVDNRRASFQTNAMVYRSRGLAPSGQRVLVDSRGFSASSPASPFFTAARMSQNYFSDFPSPLLCLRRRLSAFIYLICVCLALLNVKMILHSSEMTRKASRITSDEYYCPAFWIRSAQFTRPPLQSCGAQGCFDGGGYLSETCSQLSRSRILQWNTSISFAVHCFGLYDWCTLAPFQPQHFSTFWHQMPPDVFAFQKKY